MYQGSHTNYNPSSNPYTLDQEPSRPVSNYPATYPTPHTSTSGSSYTPHHTTTHSPASSKKSKSRFRKYTGAKTSYGDIGGGGYSSHPNYESDRYKNLGYGKPTSKHSQYTPSAPKYTGATTGSYSTTDGKYGGHGTSSYSDYHRYRPDSGYHKDYGSSGATTHTHSNPTYTSGTSYYQPVSSRPYGAQSHYQPQYADIKPSVVDTRPSAQHQPDSPAARPQQSLRQKEDTPEHNVSASIEEKASKYGGKYQTSDGKIYYGGKPKKYSSKKSKKYHNRRKTLHGDQFPPEKSDRPSV